MLTAAVLGLSTSYFGGIGLASLPFYWPDLSIFHNKKRYSKKPIRVYMDGCFDLMHYGHANALRQAKALGDELVVGVIGDEEIIANKGPPVLSMEERVVLVSGLKWVDQVITNAPYAITEKFMNSLFNDHNIDYIIHGDDPCLLPDGTDAYALAKKAGRYKQIKRTEGVSSTDIVGRILSSMGDKDLGNNHRTTCLPEQLNSRNDDPSTRSGHGGSQVSHFLPTSRRIVQFSNGKGPGPNARVVYMDGAFDLFHAGHVEILKQARKLGDFLLVGIHNDQTVRLPEPQNRIVEVLCKIWGDENLSILFNAMFHVCSERRGTCPIMHLHERSLSVLACRYVDEVIIGAPWEVSKDMITTFNISLVVHGTVAEGNFTGEVDPYAVPKEMRIFQTVESPKNTTTTSIAKRIAAHVDTYKKRNQKKEASEKRYYAEKKFVSED
ncbi:Ethanolamine-phosphate cytidylyltransferase [Asimina triloba]